MKKMVLTICRSFTHLIFRTRQFNNKSIKKFATKIKNRTILEIGSGKPVRKTYPYSVKKFFHKSNTFIQTDINKSFGHKQLDITTLKEKETYDIIICMNVLEHVFEFEKAIKNIHTALKKKGRAVIFVPGFYPLHDEPHDYWRFTEHALRKMFSNFSQVKITHSGPRRFPFAYFLIVTK